MISFLNAMLGEHSRPHAEKDEGLFRAALEAVPIAIAVSDATRPDHPVVYTNPGFTRLTGYSADEVLGRNLRLLQGPGTDPSATAALHAALAEGQPVSVELLNYRKDGRPLWVKVEISPVVDEHGEVVRFVGAMSDLSDAHGRAAAAQDSEERLRVITDAVPLPMVIVDAAGLILDANRLAARSLETDDLRGRRLDEFLDFDAVLGEGGGRRAEVRMRTAAGGHLWALASAVPFRLDDRAAAILVFVDIGELKRKEADLSRARDDAERAIRAKSRFFAAASHDLRQPLQALALFSTALDMHVSTPLARNILQSLKVSLTTMEEMFDGLLDMTRLDAGVLRAAPEVFMLSDVLERLEVEFAPQAVRKGLELRVVPSSAAVRTDPALLGRILRNFLSNALRYTRSGKILLGCKRQGANLRILVGDTGPGIPEDQRLAIFEEFYQGGEQSSSSRSGLGLGLAIVQRLARLLSHRLDVRSQPGRGSIFSVEVPLGEAPKAGGDEDDQEELALGDLSGAGVVVIDDDAPVREGLRLLMEDWGCRVVVASNQAEALELLRAGDITPEVVLADLHLHDDRDSGTTVIDELLDALGIEVPAFLFTGDTDTRDSQGGPRGRRFRVLHKPLSPVKLRAVLAEAMGR